MFKDAFSSTTIFPSLSDHRGAGIHIALIENHKIAKILIPLNLLLGVSNFSSWIRLEIISN
jgi:hypothetical protein